MKKFAFIVAAALSLALPLSAQLVPPEYQVNQPVSSLDFNGVANTAFIANTAQVLAGSLVTANVSTTAAGSGRDIALSFMPVVPASAGGNSICGQIINLNLAASIF